jgi:2-polyprenyl-3-methyl-5-hydroxy-6-metoxy-1,4-benzoquinol methylase
MIKHLRWKIAQFAERKWWQFYLKNKNVSNYLVWKKNYWQSLVSKLNLHIGELDSILDAGCGPAGMFMHFQKNTCVAFDPLINTYEKDLEHFKKSMYSNVQFEEAGLENFKSKQTFDFVFCMNAINHVQHIDLAYNNLVASVKKGGTLVISIDAHNFSFFRKLFALLPGDILHPHQYNLIEYEHFLTSRGLQLKETILLKKEFFFNHYVQVCEKLI